MHPCVIAHFFCFAQFIIHSSLFDGVHSIVIRLQLLHLKFIFLSGGISDVEFVLEYCHVFLYWNSGSSSSSSLSHPSGISGSCIRRRGGGGGGGFAFSFGGGGGGFPVGFAIGGGLVVGTIVATHPTNWNSLQISLQCSVASLLSSDCGGYSSTVAPCVMYSLLVAMAYVIPTIPSA